MTERADNKWIYGRRQDIANVEKSEHAGLWFDKYLAQQLKQGISLGKDDRSPYKMLVDAVSGISEPTAYDWFFKRWKAQIEMMRVAIDGCEYRVIARPAQAQGRIALGLGNESIIETAVTLHHTYGVPYIPGSALKGLVAAYTHRMLEGDTWRKARYENGKLVKKAGDAHTTMFGTTSSAGYVVFFDALYVPKSGWKGKPLWPDVITVHHPDYYQENKRDGKLSPPADWDSPTPIPFLTATGTYLIALGGPLTWVNLAFKLLGLALVEMGIGAKTSSGYGRMEFVTQPPIERTAASTRESPRGQSSPDSPQPESTPPRVPQLPAVGAVFAGLVLERNERAVIVEVPGFSSDRAVGLLPVAPETPKWIAGKDRARVEVTAAREQGSRIILDLKRASKAEKK